MNLIFLIVCHTKCCLERRVSEIFNLGHLNTNDLSKSYRWVLKH